VCGFLLAGVGQRDAKGANFLVVDAKTPRDAVEEAFTRFVQRGDAGLIIINQPVAHTIRPLIEAHTAKVPLVLEIPAAGGGAGAFDLKRDPIMKRVRMMLGEE
jgi:V-type H+-transporting ATPase subunit F